MNTKSRAEKQAKMVIDNIEKARKRKGLSMRQLSTAAGLRATSYWGILQNPEGVKAATMFALLDAVQEGGGFAKT